MKRFSMISILMVVLFLYVSLTYSQDLSNLELIAHYPLKGTANDTTGNNEPMELTNTPFQDGGIYCNGNFIGTDPDSCDAITTNISDFDFTSFAISAKFKVDEINTRRPIIMGGRDYRWLGLFTDTDTTVGFEFNGYFDTALNSGVKFTLGEWHEITSTHDSTEGIARLYLDGTPVDSATVQFDHHNDNIFRITHGGLALTFKGVLKDLKIYSMVAPLSDFEKDSLALVALYNSTDGANWTDNTNWLTGPVDTWQGITVMDGRVNRINLPNNNLNGPIPIEIGNLDSLQSLYLNQNSLSGAIPFEIGNCLHLQIIYLQSNQLSGSIPSEIGNLSRLTKLYLNYNQLIGSIPTEIGNLVNLETLSLNDNQIAGSIPPQLGDLTVMKTLSLERNQLTGSIPAELGLLASLNALQLTSNQILGTVPAELGNLASLTILELGYNQLTGSIPNEIGKLTQLTRIMVNNNNLSGILPDTIWSLTDLTALRLEKNRFEGIIPANVSNLVNLELFWLYDNQLTELPDLSSIAALTNLKIQNNLFTFEDIEPNINVPTFTYSPQDSVGEAQDTTVTEGASLTLSVVVGGANNQYQWIKDGSAVTGAVSNDYTIDPVNFSDAGMYTCNITNTVAIDLTLNSHPFQVHVEPISIEQDSLALVALYDSTDGTNWTDNTNWLSGPVSTWYGITVDNDRVKQIDLTRNNLVGVIPPEIGDLTAVTNLYLNENKLSGSIPPEMGNLTLCERLYLTNNQLTGAIPPEIGNLASVEYLYMGNNQFIGLIPPEIGDLSNLSDFYLYGCQLTGSIPPEICNCKNLVGLYLYSNQLTGSIPPEIGNLTNLMFLSLQENQLTGSIPSEIGNMKELRRFSFHTNQLSGSIPSEIGNLTKLAYLFIHHNQLTGAVPEQIINATKLEQIHINHNQLDTLPDLSSLTSLNTLNIYNNKFTFEDIEPNINVPTFTYSPQDSVGEAQDTTVTEGESLNLSVTVGGTANHYQWFNGGVEIVDSDSSTFIIEAVTLSDSGVYSCQITNTLAPDLTLYSRPITVHVSSGVGVSDRNGTIPEKFALNQNYPNPFNPETTIEYHLPQSSDVKLVVYDVRGQMVRELVPGNQPAGYHHVVWDSRNSAGQKVATGIYIYRIEIKGMGDEEKRFIDIKKMVLMK